MKHVCLCIDRYTRDTRYQKNRTIEDGMKSREEFRIARNSIHAHAHRCRYVRMRRHRAGVAEKYLARARSRRNDLNEIYVGSTGKRRY